MVVIGFLSFAPRASDWEQTEPERERTMRGLARASTVLFALLAVTFVISVFTLDALSTLITGFTAAMTGVGVLLQRKRLNAGH